MLDESRYTIYTNKDGRTRVYDKQTKKVTSYPRLLMADQLGRPLEADEDVHHIDGNPLNNDLSNLEVINSMDHKRQHAIKYYFEDKEMVCPICGNTFLWTAKSQRYKQNEIMCNRRSHAGPYCSNHCRGIANQQEQMRRKAQAECS